MPSQWALGIEARVGALLSDGEAAESRYRESIKYLARTRIQLARSHLLYGEWLRRKNRRVDARAQLHTAHDMLSAMGAGAFADRARRELQATGETVRKRTVETVSELTAQEAYIARLAADGRTNLEIGAQLYLSARTVEWHLRKVYTKLGLGSRRELRWPTSDRRTRGPSGWRSRLRAGNRGCVRVQRSAGEEESARVTWLAASGHRPRSIGTMPRSAALTKAAWSASVWSA